MTKYIMQTALNAIQKRSVPWVAAQGPRERRLLAISPRYVAFSLSSSQVVVGRGCAQPTMVLRPQLVAPRPIIPRFPLISGLLEYEQETVAAPLVSTALVVAVNVKSQVLEYQFVQWLAFAVDFFSRREAVFREIRKVFTYEDKEAIKDYTGDEGFVVMNRFLRKVDNDANKDEENVQERIDSVLRAMKKLPAPVFKTVKRTGKVLNKVYRGTNLPWEVGQAIEVGGTYSDPGFLSTSAAKNKCFKRDYMFTIVCKTGVDVSAHSEAKKEAEVLFVPGTQFKITKVTRKGRECAVEMEEIAETSP